MKKLLLPILIVLLVITLGLGIGFAVKGLVSDNDNNSSTPYEQDDEWTNNY